MTPLERLVLKVSGTVEAHPATRSTLVITSDGDGNFMGVLPDLIRPHPCDFVAEMVAGVGHAMAYGFRTHLTPEQRKQVLSGFKGTYEATWLDLDGRNG